MPDYNLKEHGKKVVSVSHWLFVLAGTAFLTTLLVEVPRIPMAINAVVVSIIFAAISIYSWGKNGSVLQIFLFFLLPLSFPALEKPSLVHAIQYTTLVFTLVSLYIICFRRRINGVLGGGKSGP